MTQFWIYEDSINVKIYILHRISMSRTWDDDTKDMMYILHIWLKSWYEKINKRKLHQVHWISMSKTCHDDTNDNVSILQIWLESWRSTNGNLHIPRGVYGVSVSFIVAWTIRHEICKTSIAYGAFSRNGTTRGHCADLEVPWRLPSISFSAQLEAYLRM